MIENALKFYRLDNFSRYPTQAQGLEALVSPPAGSDNWNGPYLDAVPNSPGKLRIFIQIRVLTAEKTSMSIHMEPMVFPEVRAQIRTGVIGTSNKDLFRYYSQGLTVVANPRRQKGYTLIEIMVVIAVIALIAAVAAASIGQTVNRRYSSEAEKLSIWLNQLADFAVIQGAALGVLSSLIKKPRRSTSAVIYYRNSGFEVSFPEPYALVMEQTFGGYLMI